MDWIQLSARPRHRGEGLESINIRITARNQQRVVRVWKMSVSFERRFSFATGI